MTKHYTVALTDAQDKALRSDVTLPEVWIENVVFEKCRIMMDEIVAQEVNRITANGGTLSGTKEDIVLAAPIKSAAERMAESGNSV
jgi:hypothetical protein